MYFTECSGRDEPIKDKGLAYFLHGDEIIQNWQKWNCKEKQTEASRQEASEISFKEFITMLTNMQNLEDPMKKRYLYSLEFVFHVLKKSWSTSAEMETPLPNNLTWQTFNSYDWSAVHTPREEEAFPDYLPLFSWMVLFITAVLNVSLYCHLLMKLHFAQPSICAINWLKEMKKMI